MSFSDIPKIETSKFYLDTAITRAKKRAKEAAVEKNAKSDHILKKKDNARLKIDTMCGVLEKHLILIGKSFPSFDTFTLFYKELVRTMLDFPEVKRSLGGLQWAKTRLQEFNRIYSKKLRGARTLEDIQSHYSQAVGRISSVMRQIDKNLLILDQARMIMRDFPTIKDGVITVCLSGFPNVGKSTLLGKLTPSTPDIQAYAFTTKRINVGYRKVSHHKMQFADTPGTLNRLDRMNIIEKQAYLVMKHVADSIVFVFDVTGTYPIEDQEALLKKIKKFAKPVILFVSKTDIADQADVDELKVKHPTLITEYDQLVKEIESVQKRAIKDN